jgi:hypothetical protein
MTRTLVPPKPQPDLLHTVLSGIVPAGAAAVDAYEACVRAAENLQRAAARGVRFTPAQDAFNRSAELTRDLGAAHASWCRWILGL